MDSVRLWFRQAPTCHGVSEWPGGLRRRMYLPRARRLAGGMSPGAAPAPRPTRQRTGGSSHGDVVGVRITERIPPRVAPAAALESVTV